MVRRSTNAYRQTDRHLKPSAVKYEPPKYSRSKVDAAARELLKSQSENQESELAYEIISNWRSGHALPLNAMVMDLRNKVKRVKPGAAVVQRLKRVRSIFSKLHIERSMRLSQMQDIGGCRTVVDSLAEVYKLRDLYLRSRSHHELIGENNYIKNPKRSGYRCIHLVYRFNSENRKQFNGLLIEVQLRTEIQHAWATAVETVGAFLGQALKASEGEERWLEFFRYASAAFAIVERTDLPPELFSTPREIARKLRELMRELDVEEKLSAYRRTLKETAETLSPKSGYFLLVLRPEQSTLEIMAFSGRNLKRAYDEYLRQERRLSARPWQQLSLFPELMDYSGAQTVLVGADSLQSLRRSYPNYYLDTQAFVAEVKKFIRAHHKR